MAILARGPSGSRNRPEARSPRSSARAAPADGASRASRRRRRPACHPSAGPCCQEPHPELAGTARSRRSPAASPVDRPAPGPPAGDFRCPKRGPRLRPAPASSPTLPRKPMKGHERLSDRLWGIRICRSLPCPGGWSAGEAGEALAERAGEGRAGGLGEAGRTRLGAGGVSGVGMRGSVAEAGRCRGGRAGDGAGAAPAPGACPGNGHGLHAPALSLGEKTRPSRCRAIVGAGATPSSPALA